jgi:hypothetical protein
LKSFASTGGLLIVAFCIGIAAAPGDQTTAPVLGFAILSAIRNGCL